MARLNSPIVIGYADGTKAIRITQDGDIIVVERFSSLLLPDGSAGIDWTTPWSSSSRKNSELVWEEVGVELGLHDCLSDWALVLTRKS